MDFDCLCEGLAVAGVLGVPGVVGGRGNGKVLGAGDSSIIGVEGCDGLYGDGGGTATTQC